MNRNDVEPTLADPAVRAHFVGGAFRAPAGEGELPANDPSTGRTLATFIEATDVEVDQAVRTAERTYEVCWARTTARVHHGHMSRRTRWSRNSACHNRRSGLGSPIARTPRGARS